MIEPVRRASLTLFTGAVLIVLIIWIPVAHHQLPGINEYFMLMCIWVGVIYTLAMQSFRTVGYPITLYPIFQGYMAFTGYTVLQETGFVLATFLGMCIYMLRIGEDSRDILPGSTRFTLVALLSLRFTTYLFQHIRLDLQSDPQIITLALVAAVLLTALLNQILMVMIEISGLKRLLGTLKKYSISALYPGFFILFLLPAAVQAKEPSSNVWEWNLTAGLVTILVIQTGLSIMLNRARFSHSRTRFLENELGKHSEILTGLDTPIEALRILGRFWFQAAEPQAVRVSWKNLSFTCPTGFDTTDPPPIKRDGKKGLVLEIWPSARTTLDRDRVEIFILQTETVLKNLELRDSVTKSGWKCLEAMVYSLDKSDSRQTGYSRIVSDISREIGSRMGMSSSELEDLEMAAMLHLTAAILEKAEEDWHEVFSMEIASRTQFQLPPEVVRGIKHMTENYDGSGRPDGLEADEIPLISRVLAVASSYVANASIQSPEGSVLELKRRSGLIFDPRVVEILESMFNENELEIVP